SSRSVRCIGDRIAVHDPLPCSIVNLRLIVIETQAVVARLLRIFRPVFIRISRAYKDDVINNCSKCPEPPTMRTVLMRLLFFPVGCFVPDQEPFDLLKLRSGMEMRVR